MATTHDDYDDGGGITRGGSHPNAYLWPHDATPLGEYANQNELPAGAQFIDTDEMMRETYLKRGDFTKFEVYDEKEQIWEEVSVWEMRSWSVDKWATLNKLNMLIRFIETKMEDSHSTVHLARITRNTQLEKDVLDEPYIDTVESWKIDLNEIRKNLNNG